MPLRSTILATPERLSDFLLAADDRFADAEELLAQQRSDASVYLFGYAAEMWLKATCLRLRGLGPTAPAKAGLTTLKHWMKSAAPAVPFTDYHDLAFYAQAVPTLRSSIGRPLSAVQAAELQARVVNGLYAEWVVDMRYHRVGLTPTEAWTALADTWWVKMNGLSLT